MKLKKIGKNGVLNYLGYLIIGIVVLVIVIVAIAVLTGKGLSAINYIKNLFSFGK